GGYTAANLLKWYWWRFNSYGYFWGMLAGILSAMIVPSLLPNLTALYSFPIILVISIIGCVAGSYMTPPDDEAVLKNFYLKVRPWGFWKPIHDKVVAEHPEVQHNGDFKRDMVNVAVGIVWQTVLTATGILLVIEAWRPLLVSVAVIIATTAFLKLNWYDRLQDYPDDYTPSVDEAPDATDRRVATA
ncbi:MAG: sodium:solute symporter, partial [Bacteroidota bacterium]